MVHVSVLVPIYNVKRYLRQCLDSLAAQTLEDIEFICIDDGSTDGCSEILDDYAARDARFRVIHKANSGYGASMNVGLRAARGMYVGIVESDDFAAPEMFAALFAAADAAHVDVVKSNYWEIADGKRTFTEVLRGHAYGKVFCPRREEAAFLFETPSIWSCLYRRAFLLEQGICFNETPGASYQDTSFAFLTKAYAERFLLVKNAYLHYRTDNASSSVRSTGKIFAVIDEYDAVQRHLEAHRLAEHAVLCELSARLFYQNFGFTESRIPTSMYTTFWRRGYPKLKAAQEQGVFHEDLGESMEAWMMQRYLFYQTAWLLRDGFLTVCRLASKRYLYGAGQVAAAMLKFFHRHGIEADGLLVSKREGNPPSIDDVPVHVLADAPADREHDLVVIAVTPKRPEVQQEIFFQLEQAGYRNVIVLTRELQEALA
ncbi:MAG: glycosyltransferase [Selenomonas sp.]|uniref:glycosyltransferase n=1 Tax=Selenomonas sp. TaxID=2053611 RepID=UPI0025EAB032|nr:glycosyltransferase [Selenomonas sp.]MCI6231454.1 glycosyltransferase [Selenomonas sp.]